jgi:PAS domain S-box-containing protein
LLLVLSRESSLGDVRELAHEVDDVIFAPVHPVELSARIDRLLRPRGPGPEAGEAAETALRESEARLTETEALAHAGHWEVDLETGSGWWSNELFRLLGRDPARGPASLAELLEMLHPDDLSKCREAYRDAVNGRGTPSVEFRFSIEGELKTFVGRTRPRVNAVGAVGSLQGVIVDVTEDRWRALKEAVSGEMTELAVRDRPLREFLERGAANYARLFPDLVCVTVVEDEPSRAPSVTTSTSLPDDLRRVLEEPSFHESLTRPAIHSSAVMVVEDIAQDSRCASLRSQARSCGLRACWLIPLVSTQQRALGCFAVYSRRVGKPSAEELSMSLRAARLASVVIERSRSIATLRDNEARLRALFDHSPLGVGLTDSDGRAIYANRALYALAGGLREGLHTHWSDCVHQEDRSRVLDAWERLAHGETSSVDTICRLVTASGEVRTAHALANTVHDGDATRGFVLTLEDITEGVRLEGQLRQAQKMEAVGRLAGGIAHDFNNLLAVLLSGLEVLEQDASPDERELLGQLIDTGERAASLTGQLLAFSRREPVQRSTLDLRVIPGNVSHLLQTMLGQKITLEMDLGSREAPACVNASMIEQVLMNLVINARDAMPQGGKMVLRLTASIDVDRLLPTGEKTGGVFHRISVSDTGSGIAKEDLPQIFEPFYTTKARGKGTGLGLAIVYGIVQQHGGWVEVESELGQGTTFHVYLPRARG